MVAKQNLTVYQGSDYRRVLEFKNESGVLIDLTDYTFRGQAKNSYADGAPAFSFDFTIRDQEDTPGLVDMAISAESTASLNISKITDYIYDLEMVDPNSITRRVIEGKIQLFPEVTK